MTDSQSGDAIALFASGAVAMYASGSWDLRESSRRIVAAQDGERHRLARDLHDGLQQQLVVLHMQVAMLEDGDAPAAGSADLGRLGQQLDGVIGQLREITHNLYPSILLDRGLAAALHSYAGRLPVSTRLRCSPAEFPRLAPAVESAAYFLLGEAVTNALKHADASAIDLSLTLRDDRLEVGIADDGRGFDVDADRRPATGRPAAHGGPGPLLRRHPGHRFQSRARHPGGGDVPVPGPGRDRRRSVGAAPTDPTCGAAVGCTMSTRPRADRPRAPRCCGGPGTSGR